MKEIYIRRPNNEIDLTINYKSHDLRNNTFNNRFYRGNTNLRNNTNNKGGNMEEIKTIKKILDVYEMQFKVIEKALLRAKSEGKTKIVKLCKQNKKRTG